LKNRAAKQYEGLIGAALSDKGRIAAAVVGWEKQNGRSFPWRADRTPYRVLISEVLLKRTTSTAAARAFIEFSKKYPDMRSLALASQGALEGIISKVGLQAQRSKALLEMSSHICERLNGEIPQAYDRLMEIPGIGSYTAAAVMSFGFGTPAAVVDSNVTRVFSRAFNGKGGVLPLSVVTAIANGVLPQVSHVEFNYGLLDIGAIVCRYGRPECAQCPLCSLCNYAGARTYP